MKSLRQFCSAVVLTLVLVLPVFAGDIQTPTIVGDMGNPGVAGDISSPGVAGEIGCPGILAYWFSLMGF